MKVFGHITALKEGNPDIPLLPVQKAVLLIPKREFLAPPEFQDAGQCKAAVRIRAALSKEHYAMPQPTFLASDFAREEPQCIC